MRQVREERDDGGLSKEEEEEEDDDDDAIAEDIRLQFLGDTTSSAMDGFHILKEVMRNSKFVVGKTECFMLVFQTNFHSCNKLLALLLVACASRREEGER